MTSKTHTDHTPLSTQGTHNSNAQGESPRCHLCQSPLPSVPNTLSRQGRELYFCCPGCRHVYELISSLTGKEDPAILREHPLFQSATQRGLIRAGDYRLRGISGEPGRFERDLTLQIRGMWCQSCAWFIEQALMRERGIVGVEVSFLSDTLRVRYDQTQTSPERIAEAVSQLGYQVAEGEGEEGRQKALARLDLFRLGVALFFGMQLMAYSVLQYAGYLSQLPPFIQGYLPWWLAITAAPIVFFSGWPILRKAFLEARHRTASLETLVTLGSLTAFFYSLYLAAQGTIRVYFDTAAMLVILLLVGKNIESSVRYQAVRRVGSLTVTLPSKARVISPDGSPSFRPSDEVGVGERVLVGEGEQVPLDGVIVEGSSQFDEAFLTGESQPVLHTAGEWVFAGSINLGQPVVVEVRRSQPASLVSSLYHQALSSLSLRSPLQRMVDILSRYFVLFIILLSSATAGVLLATGAPAGEAIIRAVSVLVISCPCALSVATPLAYAAAVGRASELGLIIKRPEVLELLPSIATIMLDKTGTLTQGRPRVREFHPISEQQGPEELAELAAGLELGMAHPLAHALTEWFRRRFGREPKKIASQPIPGVGVKSTDGRLHLGGDRLLEELDINSPPFPSEDDPTVGLLYLVVEGKVAAWFLFEDPLREGVREAVEALSGEGRRLVIVSGDRTPRVAALARELGIGEFYGERTPEEKYALVEEFKHRGTVMVVGDGVNDGPALAAADVSVALATGAPLAVEVADIATFDRDLMPLARLFALSRATRTTVATNLFWAVIYNLVAIPLAVAGLVDPIVAVTAMLLSSLFVVLNSARLRYRGFGS